MVNISMADAGLTTWEGKYDDAFWRPVLGVRGGDIDGNPLTVGDENWKPLGAPASTRVRRNRLYPNFRRMFWGMRLLEPQLSKPSVDFTEPTTYTSPSNPMNGMEKPSAATECAAGSSEVVRQLIGSEAGKRAKSNLPGYSLGV